MAIELTAKMELKPDRRTLSLTSATCPRVLSVATASILRSARKEYVLPLRFFVFWSKCSKMYLTISLYAARVGSAFSVSMAFDLLIADARLAVDRIHIINTERQNVVIVDSVNNRIGMQRQDFLPFASGSPPNACGVVFSVGLPRVLALAAKNRRTRKAKQVIILKNIDNVLVHIAKLAAMALVKNQDNVLLEKSHVPYCGQQTAPAFESL